MNREIIEINFRTKRKLRSDDQNKDIIMVECCWIEYGRLMDEWWKIYEYMMDEWWWMMNDEWWVMMIVPEAMA